MLRALIQKPSSQPYIIGLLVLAVILAGWSAYSSSRPDDARAAAGEQMFVDAKTGVAFSHSLRIGEDLPVRAPSGDKTGYPGTACFWNADGTVRISPFWLVTNEMQGKKGPTFCPDCGRLITDHAGIPSIGDRPPPTKSQYELLKKQSVR